MKLTDAIATVNGRIEVETFTATFEPADYEQLHTFLKAARICAAHATPQPQLDPELVDAIRTLINAARNGVTTGTQLKDAIVTARRFLPAPDHAQAGASTERPALPAFDAAAYVGLPMAINAVRNIAAKRTPDGQSIDWWPLHATEATAAYIGRVLDIALAVLESHAEALTAAHQARVPFDRDVDDLVHDLQSRVTVMQAAAPGNDLLAAAEFVQSGVHVLEGMLPTSDSPLVAELAASSAPASDVTAEQFRAAVLGTHGIAGMPTLREAITALHTLASKTLPDGRTLHWWPLLADQSQAVHVGQVLDRVLAAITSAVAGDYADVLAAHGERILAGTNLLAWLDVMSGRITHMQVVATSDVDRRAAADYVQSGVHVLIGMLPAADSPVVAELDAKLETVR